MEKLCECKDDRAKLVGDWYEKVVCTLCGRKKVFKDKNRIPSFDENQILQGFCIRNTDKDEWCIINDDGTTIKCIDCPYCEKVGD